MSDIFREVDEEVRQEQITTFLKRYGKYLAVVITLVIIGVAGYRYLEDQKQRQHAGMGDSFVAATDLASKGDTDQARAKFAALAKEDPDESYGLLSRFRIAELLAESKDRKGARTAYDEIAADSGVADVYRDLAALYSASLGLEEGGGADLAKRLDKMDDADNPWHLSVMELKGLNQYKMGQRDAAKTTFRTLFDAAPEQSGFKGRSAEMLAVLGVPSSELAKKN
ncbi:MAG: tetratricopeptide repeat protein [Alphaproteobacteria bacterium]|nr:tetratricopeptide repeat protein [Alphaproteobacteria bacterium]